MSKSMPEVNLVRGVTLKPIQTIKPTPTPEEINKTVVNLEKLQLIEKNLDFKIIDKYNLDDSDLTGLPIILSDYDEQTIIESIPMEYVGKIEKSTMELSNINSAEQNIVEFARTIDMRRLKAERTKKTDIEKAYNVNELKEIAKKLAIKLSNNTKKEDIITAIKNKLETLV